MDKERMDKERMDKERDKERMDEILERLAMLEKQVAELKQGPKEFYSFKEVIQSIYVTEDDLYLVYSSSMKTQIIRIISETNQQTPFLKWRGVLHKYEKEWIKLSDTDITYMMEHIEELLTVLYKKKAKEFTPDEFFQRAEVVYGFDLKQFKKIKTELAQSL